MVSKKVVNLIVILSLGVVLVSTIVSAGFGDWVKGIFGGEDEPELSPFEATVTIGNEPPVIISIDDVNEQSSVVTPAVVDPISNCGLGGGTPVCPVAEVVFIAEDPNSNSDLPIGGDIASKISASFSGGSYTPTLSCSEVTPCTECNANQRKYSCIVSMPYYYDSGTWNVLLSIEDYAPTPNTATCGVAPSVNCPTFTYTSTQYVETRQNPGDSSPVVGWGGIGLTATDFDQPASGPLILYNRGNVAIISESPVDLDITGQNLYGLTDNSKFIPSQRFGVGGVAGGPNSGACDVSGGGGAGTGGTAVGSAGIIVQNVIGINIPYGPSGSDSGNLNFCIWNTLFNDGLSAQDYSTTEPVNGQSWEITV